MRILVINGPNLNLLGLREPEIYGRESYADLCSKVNEYCRARGVDVEFFQSNHEGALIDRIQDAYGAFDALIVNGAGYTHTSVALRDAIAAVGLPAVEVHLTDPDAREEFRKVNFLRDVCVSTFAGRGINGYLDAVADLIARFGEKP